jgi:hypothetical protein
MVVYNNLYLTASSPKRVECNLWTGKQVLPIHDAVLTYVLLYTNHPSGACVPIKLVFHGSLTHLIAQCSDNNAVVEYIGSVNSQQVPAICSLQCPRHAVAVRLEFMNSYTESGI